MNDVNVTDSLALHRALLTLDTHIDIPWPTGPDPFQDGTRRVDLPKMQRGGLAAGCFVAYVPQSARTPDSERAAFERAMAMLQVIRSMGRTEAGITARVTVTAAEIEAAKRDGVLAVVPAVENGFAMGTDLSRLAQFRALGARYLTLTHNGHNAVADSANPRTDLGDAATEHGGLSALGHAVVGELNRLGMLIDISHATEAAQRQIVAASRAPVVASHVALRAICSNPSNLSDDVLRALVAKGGMIGIHSAAEQIGQRYYDWSRGKPSIPVNGVTREDILFGEMSLIRSPNRDYGEYIDALDAQQGDRWRRFYSQPWHESSEGEAVVPSIDDWVAHVAHAIAIGGPRSVAIGLDLTNARSTLKNFDASHYPELVEALRKHNLATPEILGENWLRVFDSARVSN